MLASRALLLLALAATTTPASAFDCAEKVCAQMQSCAEAVHHLVACGEAKRDADGDGIPCENVCGKSKEEMRRRLGGGVPPSLAAPGTDATGAAAAATPTHDSAIAEPPPAPATPAFKCAGKSTCGAMSSCEEARFYLSTCGIKRLDRDGDGVPCESLCGGR